MNGFSPEYLAAAGANLLGGSTSQGVQMPPASDNSWLQYLMARNAEKEKNSGLSGPQSMALSQLSGTLPGLGASIGKLFDMRNDG